MITVVSHRFCKFLETFNIMTVEGFSVTGLLRNWSKEAFEILEFVV